MGGIVTVAAAICGELLARLPLQNKKQREGLALLVSTALQVRSVNLNELAAALPREAERLDMRYQWISRVLGNDLIEVSAVMAPFAREVLARCAKGGRTIVVMIDQSKVNDAHQMLMVSLRVGERALPLAWRMKKTQGSIGFHEQREALEAVRAQLPEGACVTLMGDRFYGSPALIGWCRNQGWGWRLRCKQDLLVFDNSGGETTLGECFARGEHMLRDVDPGFNPGAPAPMSPCCMRRTILNRGLSPCPIRPRFGARMITVCAGASRRCSRITRRAASIWRTARSSARTGSTGSFWFSASRFTGRSPPECGTRCKTRRPPKKRRSGATQKRRARPDLMVQARFAPIAVLPPAPHAPATFVGYLEK